MWFKNLLQMLHAYQTYYSQNQVATFFLWLLPATTKSNFNFKFVFLIIKIDCKCGSIKTILHADLVCFIFENVFLHKYIVQYTEINCWAEFLKQNMIHLGAICKSQLTFLLCICKYFMINYVNHLMVFNYDTELI